MKKVVQIAQLGNSVLRLQAEKVKNANSDKISRIIDTMLDILSESNGVGLAAPQIFESLCIVIIASRPSKRYPFAPEMKPVVMINPAFEAVSKVIRKDWEGCLSIPGIRALVPRNENIKISFSDQQGKPQVLLADGFIARVFQHEYDHLNGLVYLDRVEDNKEIISELEFQKLMESNTLSGCK
jgi:peptide deformylase